MPTDLTGMDTISWASFVHAYGPATDTPGLIRDLLDSDKCGDAVGELGASILHQGTIYPATIPAMGFLSRIAGDASAPGQVQAAMLLASYARSIRDGGSRNPRYLPRNTDMSAFDQAARAALAAAVTPMLAALDSPHAEARHVVAVFYKEVETLPVTALAALHARLAVEPDVQVRTALIVAIGQHGGLGAAEKVTVRGPETRFAAAWIAVRQNTPPDPGDIYTLGELWGEHIGAFEASGACNDPIDELAKAQLGELLPLLHALAAQSRRARDGAIYGFLRLAQLRRSLLGPATAGLTGMAARINVEAVAVEGEH
jgi:hypothetical protein